MKLIKEILSSYFYQPQSNLHHFLPHGDNHHSSSTLTLNTDSDSGQAVIYILSLFTTGNCHPILCRCADLSMCICIFFSFLTQECQKLVKEEVTSSLLVGSKDSTPQITKPDMEHSQH